jgi:DNA-binding CsgD family transcriptional regulator
MKYSLLFANANDSACLISSAEEINRANALYNYNTSRRQADAMKQKAERYKYTITIGSILAILAVLFAIYIIIRYRRNAKKEFLELNTRYFETLDKYNQSEKDLRMLNDDINKFKTEKEKENESLRQAMAQYTNSNEIKEEWDAEKYILHCDVIRDLHNMATKGISASNVNWSKLTNLVSLHLSPIYSHITKSEYKLSDREILVCILIRLQFLPLEIAVLFNCSKQIVSNIRTNINRKLFQQEGTKTLDSNIKRL